jgi:glycerol-3-phosphate acyltransferase PlsX
MRIVLDAMGSDTCPDPEILASVEAARLFGDPIILVGPADRLQFELKPFAAGDSVRLVDAPDTITMKDKGLALALKAKRANSKTSMAVGIDLVKHGEADAFVTAGNTGGALATAFFRLGNLPGVERPALAGVFPVRNGTCVVLDIGANPECKPEHLVQFAVMGSVYASKVRGVANPRVGLLSNGEEAGKGNQLVKDAYPLLEASGLNFIGNLEGKELFGGQADVAVTDGFTGNILLKSSEAVSRLLVETLKDELLSSTRTKLGAALARPAFDRLRKMMDPAEVGAALLLGLNGIVFIGHGRSDARALVSAIRTARAIVASDLVNEINAAIQERLSAPAKTSPKEMA